MGLDRQTLLNPPVLSKLIALVLFIVNICAPGVGTVVAGLMTLSMKNVLIGVLQLVTAPIVIGVLWSILWGWEMFTRSRAKTPLARQL